MATRVAETLTVPEVHDFVAVASAARAQDLCAGRTPTDAIDMATAQGTWRDDLSGRSDNDGLE